MWTGTSRTPNVYAGKVAERTFEAAADLVAAIRELAEAGGHTWESTNWLSVQRGPYLVGAVLAGAGGPHVVEGNYLDLLDPQLGIVRQRELGPGQLTWLRDLTYDEDRC